MAKFVDLEVKYFDDFLAAKGYTKDAFNAMPDAEKEELKKGFKDFAEPLWNEEVKILNNSGFSPDSVELKDLKELNEKIKEGLKEIEETLNVDELVDWRDEVLRAYKKSSQTRGYDQPKVISKSSDSYLQFEVTKPGENEPLLKARYDAPNKVAVDFNAMEGVDHFVLTEAKERGYRNIEMGPNLKDDKKAMLMISCLKYGVEVNNAPDVNTLNIPQELKDAYAKAVQDKQAKADKINELRGRASTGRENAAYDRDDPNSRAYVGAYSKPEDEASRNDAKSARKTIHDLREKGASNLSGTAKTAYDAHMATLNDPNADEAAKSAARLGRNNLAETGLVGTPDEATLKTAKETINKHTEKLRDYNQGR